MNLTKRNKVIALITVAVMVVAVATACILFLPDYNKDNDVPITSTANNYGIKQAAYTADNASIAYASKSEGDLRVLFPNKIYMDKSENLEDTGYYIGYDAWTNCTNLFGSAYDSRMLLMTNIFGYYPGSSNNPNNYVPSDTSENNKAYTMHNTFDSYGFNSIKNLGSTDGSTPTIETNGNAALTTRNQCFIVPAKQTNTVVKTFLKGTIKNDYKNRDIIGSTTAGNPVEVTYTLETGKTLGILQYQQSGNWKNCGDAEITSFSGGSGNFNKISEVAGAPYKNNVEFNIYIYDKSALNTAITNFESTINSNKSLLNSLNGSDEAYNRANTFISNIKTNILQKREVTQTQINTAVTQINDYKFQLDAPTAVTGSSTYNAKPVSPENFFKISQDSSTTRYNADYYTLNILDSNPPYDSFTQITDVGTYAVSVAPKSEVNGLKFEWYNGDGNGYKNCCMYTINPKDFSASLESVSDLPYKVSDYTVNIPGYSLTGHLGGTALNPITVKLSFEDGQFDGKSDSLQVGGKREGAGAGIGAHRIYYQLTSPNHNPATGNFTVNVVKANITIKLKTYSRYYGQAIPTPDDIADNMIDYANMSIFDAATDQQKKDYIFGNGSDIDGVISSMVIARGSEPIAIVGGKYPDADNTAYSIKYENNANMSDYVQSVTLDGNTGGIYQILPLSVGIVWHETTQWYDGKGGKRPTAELASSAGSVIIAGTDTDIRVNVVGDGEDFVGGTAELVGTGNNKSAIWAGTYTAKAVCTNSNYIVDRTNDTISFTIERRKIDVTINDRARTYAQALTAQGVWNNYMRFFAANSDDSGNSIYTLTLNSSVTDGKPALGINDEGTADSATDIFTVTLPDIQYTLGEESERYYKAGVYTLRPTLLGANGAKARNYLLNGTDGTFTVNPAAITFTLQNLPSQVFMGKPLDFVVETSDTRIGLKGWESQHRDDVKIYFGDTEDAAKNSNSEAYLQGEDVAIYDVWCRIEAPNHEPLIKHISAEISQTTIYVDVTEQTRQFVYGNGVPTSAELQELLGINYYWSTDTALNEKYKIENMQDRAQFYLLTGVGGHFNAGDKIGIKTGDGGDKYTVSHGFINGEKADNYNIVYVTDNGGVHKNVNAFTVSKKDLHADWTQDGAGWNNVDGVWKFTFSGSAPTVKVAPVESEIAWDDSIKLSVNVVAGETLAANVGEYHVYTALTTTVNILNYNLIDSQMTFNIVPLSVRIDVTDVEREFGTVQQNPPLGKRIALAKPGSATALWNYASGSAQFVGDDYSSFCLVSDAITADGSYQNVNTDGYPISVQPLEGSSETVTGNYDVTVANGAVFRITPADIHYMGRQFNIAADDEATFVTREQIRSRIAVEGISGISLDDFTVLMTDLKKDDNTPSTDWITADQTTAMDKVTGLGKYYISIQIENPNFNTFNAEIEVNIRSKWISVVIDGYIEAQYADTTDETAELYDKLKDKVTVYGMEESASTSLDAWNQLKDTIDLFVGSGDTTTPLTDNSAVGRYSIYFDTTAYEAATAEASRKYFRFLANGNSNHTSNIDAYHVIPRYLDVAWQDMDEVYGYHSASSPSHTYKDHLVVAPRDASFDFRTSEKYEKYNEETGEWEDLGSAHAKDVGRYRVTVTEVNNSNYQVGEGLCEEFEITQREVHINVLNRTTGLVYGSPRATKDRISEYLNETAQDKTFYEVVGDVGFVDEVSSIFRYALATSLGSQVNYLNVATYAIGIEMLDNSVAKNYKVTVDNQGEFEITNAAITYDRAQFAPRVFTGNAQKVEPAGAYYTLSGDVTSADATLEYKIEGSSDEFTADLYVTEVGTYKILIKITAPNHDVFTISEAVSFYINPVNVEISMTQTEKTFGDTLDELLAAESVDSFHQWLVKKCNITFDTYTLVDGRRQHVDVNADRLNSDFLFKVIQNDQGNGTPIEVGKNRVGTYTVSHENEGAYADKLGSYVINYYQEEGKTQRCNYDAYKIIQRVVDVQWSSTATPVEGNNVFEYYRGQNPGLIAQVQEAGKTGLTSLSVEHRLAFVGDREKDALVYNVGSYIAEVIGDGSFNMNDFLVNYDLQRRTFDYTIVPRGVTVTLNALEVKYGEEESEVGAKLNVDGGKTYFTVDGEEYSYVNAVIDLKIDESCDRGFYSVGSHPLKATCTNQNYNVTTANAANVQITPADITLSGDHSHDFKYSGKDLVVDIKANIKQEGGYTLAGDMTWDDAVVTYKQQDGSYSDVKPVIKGVNTDGVLIQSKVSLANHNDREFNVIYRINRADLVIEFQSGGAYSTYGDSLLGSNELFEKTGASLTDASSLTDINLKDLISLKVDVTGEKTPVGIYNLTYVFKDADDAQLYNVTLQNAHVYEVKEREITIEWSYTQAFEYNGNSHSVTAQPVGALQGDTVNIIYSGNTAVDADEYTATVDSIDNSNYKLGATASLVWKINPRAITVAWVAGDFTYDGNEHIVDVPSVQSGLIGAETAQITVSGAKVRAGRHIATAVSENTNYVVSNSEFEFEIKQASVTVSWSGDTLTYNGEAQAPTAEITAGIIGNDVCNITVSGANTNAGSYTATASLSNSDYKIAQDGTCAFVINAKEITFTWNDDALVYNGSQQAPTLNAVGTVKNDVVEFVVEGMEENAGSGYVAKVVGVKNNANYTVKESAKQNTKTFSIAKGVNRFESNDTVDSIVDVLPWSDNKDDKPTATWGEVVIKYYSDENCTAEVTDIANAQEGRYWVKISVAGTANYDEISKVFEVQLQGGLEILPIVLGAVVTVALLLGALAVVLTTNKKNKKQGGAV